MDIVSYALRKKLTQQVITDFNDMRTATASDVGKALKAKTVIDGKVTEWEFGEAGGDNNFFVVEVTTDWWTYPPSKTANCTWSELTATTKPILWNKQIAQVYNDLSGGRIAYMVPLVQTGVLVPSAYEVRELVFEATGYTVTENSYTTNTDMRRDIAPLYSEYLTYNVGDLVYFNNGLYQCTTAVSAPESFNFFKWTSTTIASVIASL